MRTRIGCGDFDCGTLDTSGSGIDFAAWESDCEALMTCQDDHRDDCDADDVPSWCHNDGWFLFSKSTQLADPYLYIVACRFIHYNFM
jgi:hypothetical protein